MFLVILINFLQPLILFMECVATRNTRECGSSLILFIVGEAKMAIYLSRWNRLEGLTGKDAIMVWQQKFCCRIQLEFYFFKAMSDLNSLSTIWYDRNILGEILNGKFFFFTCSKSEYFCCCWYLFFHILFYFLFLFSEKINSFLFYCKINVVVKRFLFSFTNAFLQMQYSHVCIKESVMSA